MSSRGWNTVNRGGGGGGGGGGGKGGKRNKDKGGGPSPRDSQSQSGNTPPRSQHTLVVRNIGNNSETTLRHHFSRYGKVVRISGLVAGSTVAFVTFMRGDELQEAVKEQVHMISGRRCRVERELLKNDIGRRFDQHLTLCETTPVRDSGSIAVYEENMPSQPLQLGRKHKWKLVLHNQSTQARWLNSALLFSGVADFVVFDFAGDGIAIQPGAKHRMDIQFSPKTPGIIRQPVSMLFDGWRMLTVITVEAGDENDMKMLAPRVAAEAPAEAPKEAPLGPLVRSEYRAVWHQILMSEHTARVRLFERYTMERTTIERMTKKGSDGLCRVALTNVSMPLLSLLVPTDLVAAWTHGVVPTEQAPDFKGHVVSTHESYVVVKFDTEFPAQSKKSPKLPFDVHFSPSRDLESVKHAAVEAIDLDLVFPTPTLSPRVEKDAVQAVVKRRLPVLLITGPSKSGKSTLLAQVAKAIVDSDASARVLVCAARNKDADTVARNLKTDFVRLYDADHNRNSIPTELLPHVPERANMGALVKAPVIVTTAVGSAQLRPLGTSHFTHVLVDNADRVLEGELLVALSLVSKAQKAQLVLAADEYEVAPALASNHVKASGLGVTLVRRLLDSAPRVRLSQVYGTTPMQLQFINEYLYEGRLHSSKQVELPSWPRLPNPQHSVLFYGVAGREEREGDDPSIFNRFEACVLLDLVQSFLSASKLQTRDIGVVCVQAKMAEKVRTLFRAHKLGRVKVDTPYAFLTKQKTVLFLSMVRESEDSVTDEQFFLPERLLNTLMPRASSMFIVAGNPRVLWHKMMWRRFLRTSVEHGNYFGPQLPATDDVDTWDVLHGYLGASKDGDVPALSSTNGAPVASAWAQPLISPTAAEMLAKQQQKQEERRKTPELAPIASNDEEDGDGEDEKKQKKKKQQQQQKKQQEILHQRQAQQPQQAAQQSQQSQQQNQQALQQQQVLHQQQPPPQQQVPQRSEPDVDEELGAPFSDMSAPWAVGFQSAASPLYNPVAPVPQSRYGWVSSQEEQKAVAVGGSLLMPEGSVLPVASVPVVPVPEWPILCRWNDLQLIRYVNDPGYGRPPVAVRVTRDAGLLELEVQVSLFNTQATWTSDGSVVTVDISLKKSSNTANVISEVGSNLIPVEATRSRLFIQVPDVAIGRLLDVIVSRHILVVVLTLSRLPDAKQH